VFEVPVALLAVLVTAGVHLGFQLTVTLLVYPALADVPTSDWPRVHRAHSRRITPLVALVYVPLAVTGVWALVTVPVGPALVVAAVGAAASALLTAALAAPLHGRLGRQGPRPDLVRRLLLVDRARAVTAAVCLAGAVLAVGAG
jgi:hypothetical protein